MKRFEGSPFNLWAQCGAELVVRHLWSCEACGYQFGTSIYFPLPNEERHQVQPQGADRRVH
jgi:ribosomal protein L37AE/L43A